MIVLIISYFYWHYLHALPFLMQKVDDALLFVTRSLAAKELLKNFFTPWVYYEKQEHDALHIPRLILSTISDLLLRLLGIIIRIAALAICLALQVVVLAVGLVVLILWILLPLICVSVASYFIWLLF